MDPSIELAKSVTGKNSWKSIFAVGLILIGFAFAFVNTAILIHESVKTNDIGILIYASISMTVFAILLILMLALLYTRHNIVKHLKKSLYANTPKSAVIQSDDVTTLGSLFNSVFNKHNNNIDATPYQPSFVDTSDGFF